MAYVPIFWQIKWTNNCGRFHQYSICGCQIKTFQNFSKFFSINEMALSFWQLLLQIWSNFAEVFTRDSILADNNSFWITFEKLEFLTLGYPNMSKTKVIFPLPFPGKLQLLFYVVWDIFAENRAGSQVEGSKSKFNISYSPRWSRWKWRRGVTKITSPFLCCPVNQECLWKKTQKRKIF